MMRQYKRLFCFLAIMFFVIIPLAAFPSTTQYTYDSLDRITKVDYGDGFVEEYTYDAAGNRLAAQFGTVPPSAIVVYPSNDALISQNIVVISGTAIDVSDLGVQKVEVSTDEGATWHLAKGTTSWTYTSTFLSSGTYQIMVRTTDNTGNVKTESSVVSVRVNIPEHDGWTPASDVPVYYLAYGNNAYVAGGNKYVSGVGAGGLYTSSDLESWDNTYTVISQGGEANVRYLNNAFYGTAGTYDASSNTSTVKILSSPDGSNWSERMVVALSGKGSGRVEYLNGLFIAPVSAYNSVTKTTMVKIFVSADGNSWSEQYSAALPGMLQAASGASSINVTYMKNVFLAYMAIYNGTANSTAIKIISSADGNSWTESYSDSLSGSGFINPMVFGNNTLLASFYAYNYTAQSSAVKAVTSTDGTAWTVGNTWSLTGIGGGGVAFLNNAFVASMKAYDQATSSTTAKFFFSPDGASWSEKYSTTFPGTGGSGMAYGGNTFAGALFATNSTGASTAQILSSPDGNTWTETFSGTYQGSIGGKISYINNTFFMYASVYDGSASTTTVKLYTSSDGNIWTERYSGAVRGSLQVIGPGVSYPVSVVCLNNTYVLWFNGKNVLGGAWDSKILLSSDGNTWTEEHSGNVAVTGVNLLNGNIVAFGYDSAMNGFVNVLASATAEKHTLTVTRGGPGSGFVTSTPSGINCGSTCTEKYDPDTLVTLVPTPAGGSVFAGWSGACSGTGACMVLMNSPKKVSALFGPVDGPLSDLQTRFTIPDASIRKIVYGNDMYVALIYQSTASFPSTYSERIFTSPDGITWTERILNDGSNDPNSSIYYLGCIFLRTSNYVDQATFVGSSRLFSSTDGITWTERSIPNAEYFGGKFYYYNNAYYASALVDGSGKLFRSADLTDWTEVVVAENFSFCGLYWFDGKYIATGTDSGSLKLFASPDGVQWIEKTAPAGVTFAFNFYYYDSTYFATGADSQYNFKLFISTDLSSWTAVPIEPRSTGLAYYNNTYFLSGFVSNSGGLFTSSNGINWTSRNVGSNLINIFKPSYLNNVFFAIGTDANYVQHLYYSYDGILWTEQQTLNNASTLNINFLGDTYLVYSNFVDASSGKQTAGTIAQSAKADVNAYRLVLNAGWNFISFPKQLQDTAINVVLKDISSDVRIVWGYDNQNKTWKKYKPSDNGSQLSALEPYKGYWFYMDNPAVLSVSGADATSPVALFSGWNLVGYNGESGTINPPSGWIIIWGWENGVWYAKHSSLNDLTTLPLNSLSKGKAYWIKTNTDVEWVQ